MPPATASARHKPFGFTHRRTVILGALAVCAVGAALLAHYRLVRPRRQGRSSQEGVVWQWPRQRPEAPPGDPLELSTRPLAGTGMEVLRELPPEMILPRGAVKSFAFRRTLPDGVQDGAVCVVEADIEAVESFYRTTLERAGYKFMRRGPGLRPGVVEMLFLKGAKDLYRVSLRPADKGKKVRIALVISR